MSESKPMPTPWRIADNGFWRTKNRVNVRITTGPYQRPQAKTQLPYITVSSDCETPDDYLRFRATVQLIITAVNLLAKLRGAEIRIREIYDQVLLKLNIVDVEGREKFYARHHTSEQSG